MATIYTSIFIYSLIYVCFVNEVSSVCSIDRLSPSFGPMTKNDRVVTVQINTDEKPKAVEITFGDIMVHSEISYCNEVYDTLAKTTSTNPTHYFCGSRLVVNQTLASEPFVFVSVQGCYGSLPYQSYREIEVDIQWDGTNFKTEGGDPVYLKLNASTWIQDYSNGSLRFHPWGDLNNSVLYKMDPISASSELVEGNSTFIHAITDDMLHKFLGYTNISMDVALNGVDFLNIASNLTFKSKGPLSILFLYPQNMTTVGWYIPENCYEI